MSELGHGSHVAIACAFSVYCLHYRGECNFHFHGNVQVSFRILYSQCTSVAAVFVATGLQFEVSLLVKSTIPVFEWASSAFLPTWSKLLPSFHYPLIFIGGGYFVIIT